MTLYGTTPTQVDTSIPEIWARGVMRDSLRTGFWSRFIGAEGSGSPIIQKTELLNNPGDTIHISITSPLTGSGQTGDQNELIGNEETLSTTEKIVVPEEIRHAVRVQNRANKKSIIDLRSEAKLRLAEWGGEKLDDRRFAGFTSATALHGQAYTPNLRVVAGGTGVDDVGVGDTLDVATIMKAKLDMYNNRAKPLRMQNGEDIFALVAHPNSCYDLKRSSEYKDWLQNAEVRGKDNPFFVGALVMIDGVVIFEHSNVPTVTNGSSQLVSKNLMFGQEAFIEGLDQSVSWFEDQFDYGKEWGVAYGFAQESRRGLEKNSLQLLAAANAPA